MQEIWKDIAGFEGYYQVSNMGNVYSVRSKALLKPILQRHGYVHVSLCKKGVQKEFSIHRLVAVAHIPNPDNLPLVNHKEGDKTDNRAHMLEWATTSENNFHAYKTGLKKVKRGKDHHRSKPLEQIDTTGKVVKVWGSVLEIERELGINNANICAVALGNRKTAGGFKWKYAS